jgi:hypothetical protein
MSKKKVIEETRNSNAIRAIGNAIGDFFRAIGSIGFKSLFKVATIALLVVILAFLWRIASSRSAVEKIVEKTLVEEKKEESNMNIRDIVSPKIQKRLAKIVTQLGADRAFAMEIHNGKKNTADLPFKFFNMSYEEVDEDRHIKYVSQHFTEGLLSHYKLPYYLAEHKYFIGNAEQLSKIDHRLANIFIELGGEYFGVMILRSGGNPVGFLGVAFNNEVTHPSDEEIYNTINYESRIIGEFLDLNKMQARLQNGECTNED